MTDPSSGRTDGDGAELLRALDPDLNIFALANGVDLLHDEGGGPNRVLEWFSEGMERRIHLDPSGPGAVDLDIAARGRRGAGPPLRVRFETGVTATVLKPTLGRAVDAANALTPGTDADP